MKDQILKLFNESVSQNLALVATYGASINEGPAGFIELKVGRLSLVQVSQDDDGWRLVSACYSKATASSMSMIAETVTQQNLRSALSQHLRQASLDLSRQHDVWRALAII